jgi:hypothetical protein
MFSAYPNAETPVTAYHIRLRQRQVEQMRRQFYQAYVAPASGGLPLPAPMFRQRAIDPAHSYTLPTLFVPSHQTPNHYRNHIAFNTGAHDQAQLMQDAKYIPAPMPRARF